MLVVSSASRTVTVVAGARAGIEVVVGRHGDVRIPEGLGRGRAAQLGSDGPRPTDDGVTAPTIARAKLFELPPFFVVRLLFGRDGT